MIIKDQKSCLILSEEKIFQSTLVNILKPNSRIKSIIAGEGSNDTKSKIKNQRFSLFIADCNSFQEDHWIFLLEAIKNQRILPSKIIVLSKELENEATQKLAGIGIENVIIKPFNLTKFNEAVDLVLNQD